MPFNRKVRELTKFMGWGRGGGASVGGRTEEAPMAESMTEGCVDD